MKWQQIDIVASSMYEEVAVACLTAAGCPGVQVIRPEVLPEYEQSWGLSEQLLQRLAAGADSEQGPVIIRGFFPPDDRLKPAITQRLIDAALPGPLPEVQQSLVEDPGWSRSWRKYFRARRIGKRLMIIPSWSRYRPRPGDVPILLDPGMAFGTGQHASTRLALEAIEDHMSPGSRVIDVGCGSGILSVAAAKLGAQSVLALDLDAIAVSITAENARINGAEDRIVAARGTLGLDATPISSEVRADRARAVVVAGETGGETDEAAGSLRAELVIANILAPVVIDLAPAAAACLRAGRGGLFVTSGIVISQEDEVRRALSKQGMEVVDSPRAEDWVCVIARVEADPGCQSDSSEKANSDISSSTDHPDGHADSLAAGNSRRQPCE
jgi:ribosomal protein L11 methyltransferase